MNKKGLMDLFVISRFEYMLFFLCSLSARGQNRRMDCRTFEGESNCFQVQTGVTRDLPTTVAFLEK